MLIAIVGLIIITTVGFVGYRFFVEQARERVCLFHQDVLRTALENYAIENDVLPASLSEIIPYIKNAYVMEKKKMGVVTKLSYFFVKYFDQKNNSAYAQVQGARVRGRGNRRNQGDLKNILEGVPEDIFKCPSDTNGGVSYGINAEVLGKKWEDIPDDTVIIGDYDIAVFRNTKSLARRHGNRVFPHGRFALGALKRKGKFRRFYHDKVEDVGG